MIDLYYWTAPNGHRITMFLEETGTSYTIEPINISRGDQFKPEFLSVSPNDRIPAIIDHAPADGGKPIPVFEPSAILLDLTDKLGKLPPPTRAAARRLTQWLMWQMGGLGPIAGQNHHCVQYAPENPPNAIDRYVKETNRLYGVLNKRLADRSFVAGDYSIADMAVCPWIVPHERQRQKLDDFPHLERWFETIRDRPATRRAHARTQEINTTPSVSDDRSRQVLFGQSAPAVH